jgi:hypothetical protein
MTSKGERRASCVGTPVLDDRAQSRETTGSASCSSEAEYLPAPSSMVAVGSRGAAASKPDKERTSLRSEDTVLGNKASTAPLASKSCYGHWLHALTRADCATLPVEISEPGRAWTGSSLCGATPAAIGERSGASSKPPNNGGGWASRIGAGSHA